MTDVIMQGLVGQDSPRSDGEGQHADAKINKRGELCVCNFFTEMALEGRAYQVRAGTVTTHLTGDDEITDQKAEMCVDAPLGTTAIPCYVNVHVEALVGTVPIIAAKSAAAISTAGTAFIPLPLYMGGNASSCSARVTAEGGVTVTAEAVTTTRRHFSATMASADMIFEWKPLLPPVCAGASCFYVQVAATGGGPSYYASIDFVELPTINLS